MSVANDARLMLPDSGYAMWLRGELANVLNLPKDGSKVEIVGGKIIVSPGPGVDHSSIIRDIEKGLFARELTDPAFRWRGLQVVDVNIDFDEGYIPDLVVVDADVLSGARGAGSSPGRAPDRPGGGGDLAIELPVRP